MRIENMISMAPEILAENKSGAINKPGEFKDILKNIVSETKELRQEDVVNNNLMASGEIDSLDNIMIQMEKADIALQFTMQIRLRILKENKS